MYSGGHRLECTCATIEEVSRWCHTSACLVRDRRHNYFILVAIKSGNEVLTGIVYRHQLYF